MTISTRSHEAMDRLSASTQDLLHNLEILVQNAAGPGTADAWRHVIRMISRDLSMLIEGRNTDEPTVALRGANGLTTVNKGVADAQQTVEEESLGDKALTVLRDAIEAARFLRADAGMAF